MNCHYLLRDSNEIFGIYTSLDNVYFYLLQFIYNCYRYQKILSSDPCNIKMIIKNFQIIKYDNNIIINVYQLDNSFKLIDINSEQLIHNNILINDLISKLVSIIDDISIDSNELKLFIPVTITETEIDDTVPQELKDLKKKIEMLNQKKHNETNKIKEEQLFMQKIKNESIKNKLELNKEHYIKAKDKFKIDKDIYFKIKNEIENGERSEKNLPLLFIDEYNIFNELEKNNILDINASDELFNEYIKYKPDKKQSLKTMFDDIFDNDNWGNQNLDTSDSD